MKILCFVILGCVVYVLIAAIVRFVCEIKEIGTEVEDDYSSDNAGATLLTIFWPVGIWIVLAIGTYRALCESYEKSEKKRKIKKMELEIEEQEMSRRLIELERELASSS